MSKVEFLRGIAMRAPHIAQGRAFFETSWGLRLAAAPDGALYFRGSGPEQWLYGLVEDRRFGIDHIHLGVADATRLAALHARLAGLDLPLSGPPAPLATPGGGIGFTLLDPEGRRLTISAEVARHADTADLTGQPRKVSHVVLNTPALEAMRDFYTEVLGFKVSDYSADAMVFLRCATDHHSIAFNRADYASVNHVAFEMPSLDSFMRGIGRMKGAGQAPGWGPGRHGPGDNPFAYFVSPQGFAIEFTAEVQQVGEDHQPQIWPRDVPEKVDQWQTAGPPSLAMRTVMAGRPDPGWQSPA
jgi:catechol 2,3-dioxygenase-like lactoylglutathione lyase family enzyme